MPAVLTANMIRLLLGRLAGEYTGAGRTVLIPTDLVLRESA
jgi:hypothetical protein